MIGMFLVEPNSNSMESIADVKMAHKGNTEEPFDEEEWVLLHRVEHRQQNCWTCDEVELSLIQLQGHYTVFHG